MDIQTAIAIGALLVSTAALFLSKKSFKESNRPIVTAEIKTYKSGNIATTFNLHVYNTGNRPACNIRLYARKSKIIKIINNKSPKERHKEIYKCFSENGLIPLLHPGKETQNAFGLASTNEKESTLNYNLVLPIKIVYKDLDNRKYTSKLSLTIKDSESFAGTSWK